VKIGLFSFRKKRTEKNVKLSLQNNFKVKAKVNKAIQVKLEVRNEV
jgi:hypothetical protein